MEKQNKVNIEVFCIDYLIQDDDTSRAPRFKQNLVKDRFKILQWDHG